MVKEQGNTTGGKTNSRAPVYGDSQVSRMSGRQAKKNPNGASKLTRTQPKMELSILRTGRRFYGLVKNAD